MDGCVIGLTGQGFPIGVSPSQQVSEPLSCVWPPATFLSVAWTVPGELAAYEMSVTEALTAEEIV